VGGDQLTALESLFGAPPTEDETLALWEKVDKSFLGPHFMNSIGVYSVSEN
jgi:hypothetical protein